jgi:WD40 repeat protein
MFLPDSYRLLDIFDDDMPRIWDLEVVVKQNLFHGRGLPQGHHSTRAVTILYPSGRCVATFTAAVNNTNREGSCDPVFSPDGRFLAYPIQRIVYIWHVKTASLEGTVPGEMNRNSFSPDSRYFVTWNGNNKTMLWNTEVWKLCIILPGKPFAWTGSSDTVPSSSTSLNLSAAEKSETQIRLLSADSNREKTWSWSPPSQEPTTLLQLPIVGFGLDVLWDSPGGRWIIMRWVVHPSAPVTELFIWHAATGYLVMRLRRSQKPTLVFASSPRVS